MDKIIKLLQELAGIILNEVSETDMKKLRRVVILAIFSSNIPAQLKKDLNQVTKSKDDYLNSYRQAM